MGQIFQFDNSGNGRAKKPPGSEEKQDIEDTGEEFML